MAFLGASLVAVLMLTLVTSKPICLQDGDDDSWSSESSESSEEAGPTFGPSPDTPQPAETDAPDAIQETTPLDTGTPPPGDAGPSLATALDASAPPDFEDPQTSADPDAPQLLPDDPSRDALGTDISLDMPESDPQNPLKAANAHVAPDAEAWLHPDDRRTGGTAGTEEPQVATADRRFSPGTSTPFPPHVLQTTPLSLSATPPLQIPIGTALTGLPVCFTLQLVTPEPKPVRGDNI